ncbi:Alpha/beta hydrolase of unknown function (DUF1023) [Sanguibacter keddieii DSM 10542]|uniref:DUF1023 domain-containing protein n=1 Tax=Sanguibacter keddieii (strain ATCC 51767 / DSM 10542 / NCFB 3025 / ST-74) TaxID=446469 RepID=D1BBG6_SANKS|nr:alpha/beta hydrolase [Sanguibacter keddieii]ACZ20732.1 Alpha/beta hydrolase of unknown function (DUF1023) [Sanguibacter keddieii DSM 10542]
MQTADIPGGDVNTEGVVTSARAVRDASERLRSAGDQVVGIWAGLPHCYDAPEAPTLYAAMHPVARDTVTYAEAAGAAATALTRYAEDVASVQARMQVTAPLVEALAGRIAATPVWRSDASITSQNSTLQRQVRGAQEDLDRAADVCAAAIRGALIGGGRAATPWLTAPRPISAGALQQHLTSLDDPRTNPFFFLGKTPADVNARWRGLSPGVQRQLITDRPDLVGNRDGIPAAARDEANRIRLATAREEIEKEIRDLERRLAGDPRFSPHNPDYAGPQLPVGPLLWDEAGQMLLRRARARLEGVAALERVVERGSRQLLTFRPTPYAVRAAVSIGDLDQATHVGILVGGTGTTVAGKAEDIDRDAHALLRTANALEGSHRGTTSLISWLDYDAPPELTNALSPLRSRSAGQDLASFTHGISAIAASQPSVTIFGHSYGALVVNEAAARAPESVQNIVVGGAPGVGRQSADDVTRYTLLAKDDPIRAFHVVAGELLLGHVPDGWPSDETHGPWHRLSTAPHSLEDGSTYLGSSGHSEYLIDQSTSQRSIAALIAGHAPISSH